MKKLLLSLFMLLISTTLFAFETNSLFGIKKQQTVDGYQQYVGKSFFFREAYGKFETWRKSGFNYDESYQDLTFTIKKISVKEVELNDKPNKEVTIEAVQDGAERKVKFKGYEELSIKLSIWTGEKRWPLIDYMPIVFVDPYKEYKEKHIGEIITHNIVKDQYEVIDFNIGKDKDEDALSATNIVTVKNLRTGETYNCPYEDVKTAPFESALTGKYKTALIKVEKPEDQTERYGETTTIQDEGVDKYSYKDDIIDILIFGTSTEFSFTLKNVSDHSIKIIWNEAAFVGLDGNTSKIMHVGTKYADREQDQPSTTIIKGAKIDDLATPTANVYYNEGYLVGYTRVGSGWKTRSMLPGSYKGKDAGEIRLMLPIQVKDIVNEYTFVFKVYYTYDHPELLNTENL